MGPRFDRHYGNFPLRSPSRASIFFGRRPPATQVLANGLPIRIGLETAPFWPEILMQNDYFGVRAGKGLHSIETTDVAARHAELHSYYATLAKLDDEVGRLMDALDAEGLWSRTIVIFTSDNGLALFEHGTIDKRMVWDAVLRLPLIVVAPGFAPSAVNRVSESVDLYPTLMQAAGLKGPNELEGRSLYPLLTSAKARGWKKAVPSQLDILPDDQGNNVPRRGRAIVGRAGGILYRYTKWKGEGKGKELYDLESDPDEFDNLALLPAYQKVIDKLQELAP